MKEAKEPAQVETEYSKAWNKFIGSNDYVHCHEAMKSKGMRQPYINNILRVAFDVGWNAKHELSKPQP